MTSTGRRTAIGLCAMAVTASAGCAASPRYPIEAGQPMGDGGVHMTEHPQYPIDAAGAAQPSSSGAYPATAAPPPPPEDDDAPRAPTSSGSVDSSELPPPPPPPPGQARLDAPASGEAPPAGFRSAAYVAPSSTPMLFSDGEVSPLFERAAYRHHRRHAETADAAASDAKVDTPTTEPKHSARWLRRHPREAARIAAAEAKDDAAGGAHVASTADTPQHSRAWLRRHPREAARIAAADVAAKREAASTEPAAQTQAAASTPQHSRLWLRRHPREAARIAAAEKASAETAAPSTESAAPAQTASATLQHSRAWLRRHPREAARIAAAERASAEAAAASSEPAAPAETASVAPQHSRAWLRRHPREAAKLARAAERESSPAAEGRPHGFSYVIQKGDTLYAVSHRFDLDPIEVAKLNHLHGIGLQPGQTFDLPQMAKDLGARQHAVGVAHPVPTPVRLAETTRRRRREGDAAAPQTLPTDSRSTETSSVAGTSPATSEASATGSGSALPSPSSSVQTAQASPTVDAAASARATHEATTRADRAATRRAEREARLANARLSRQARRTQAAESAAVSAPYVVHPYTALAAGSGATGVSSLPSTASAPAGSTETNPTDDASVARPAPSTYASAQPPASSPPPISSPPVSSPTVSPPTVSSPAYSTPAPRPSYAYSPPPRPTPSYVAPTSRPASSYTPTPSTASGGYSPGQVASLNAPSYGGPTLGRVRPAAPVATGGVVSSAAIATAGQGRFVWPLHGAILQPFGDRGPGQRNDGLDIAAQPGQSVHAAAGGEVVYAGSSIPGFGNLVLVKHPGGWVTAYAHLDRIEVRMRDSVAQGEEIGQAGQTGAVTQPQLHFEVRYSPDANGKARPVDPALVLPGSG